MKPTLEKQMADLLESNGIAFTRPEQDQHDPTTLDFYLPDFKTYIEVKMYHSSRIDRQFEAVPKDATAILLQGLDCVRQFEKICKLIRAN
jgi:hypothetical protein